MIMCVLLCYPVSIRIYYQQGVLFLVLVIKPCIYKIIRIWNDMPDDVRSAKLSLIQKEVKNQFFGKANPP